MNHEVVVSSPKNPLQPNNSSHIGEDVVETPFAVHLEPMPDGWVRVRVEGELALDSSSTLERAVEAELRAHNHVLLDLSQIQFIDSAGLRAMTALVRMAKASGRKLRLSTDLPAHARRLMEIVGLLPFVPIGVEDPWSDGSGPLADPPRA
ncbi:MAG TPA: STAS domain-containing protein [Solirubrobacteraceae bacterium]|nr:STAS domain-containing protein [Solirubrobacteraceae bacterium]